MKRFNLIVSAVAGGRFEIVKFLLKINIDFRINNNAAIKTAANNDHVRILNILANRYERNELRELALENAYIKRRLANLLNEFEKTEQKWENVRAELECAPEGWPIKSYSGGIYYNKVKKNANNGKLFLIKNC